MGRILLRAQAVGLIFAVCSAAAARAETIVEFAVRRPDGRAAANVAVEVALIDRIRFPTAQNNKPTTITTDAEGTARYPLVGPATRLRVTLPGEGCAVTDLFNAVPGGKISVGLPRLVPFGSIQGILPEALRGDDITLDPQAHLFGIRTVEPIEVGRDGRFVFKNLGPARYILQPQRDGKPLEWVANVTLSPGETATVTPESFHPDPQFPRKPRAPAPVPDSSPVAPSPPTSSVVPGAERAQASPEAALETWPVKPVVWYAGTVRDENGRPASGVKVFAHGEHDSGLRSWEVALETETDHLGRWEIRSINRDQTLDYGARIVAKSRERPSAFAACRVGVSPWRNAVPLDAPERHDLVLPARESGGRLFVRVLLEDGRPAADASVVVTRGTGPYVFTSFNRIHIAALEALEDVLKPMVKTDSEGRAYFSDLSPGLYSLVASEGPATARNIARGGGWHLESPPQDARCYGVPVRRGEASEYVIRLAKRLSPVQLELRDTEGRPIADKKTSLERKRPGDGGYGTQGLEFDAQGRASLPAYASGLTEARIRFLEGVIQFYPVRDGPFYEAEVVLAGSALLKDFPPLVLTTGYQRPAAVRLLLRDVDGRPARGSFKATGGAREPSIVGGTDDDGMLAWKNFAPGKYSFTPFLPGIEAPACREESPFADDRSLTGLKLLLSQSMEVKLGCESALVFEPRPVGYVRGRVRPAKGCNGADYHLEDPENWNASSQYRTYYDAATGEFLLGPLPVGKTRITLLDVRSPSGKVACAAAEVEVRNDRVTLVELTAAEPKPVPAAVPEGTGPATRLRSGIVMTPDGKTPAAGAALYVYRRESEHGRQLELTDSDGRFTYRLDHLLRGLGGDERGPLVFAAWLPGIYPPMTAPLPAVDDEETELKIVLNASRRLKGRVTIGGDPVEGLGTRLRVLLAADQATPVDRLIENEITPSADGTFDLGAPPAGKYRLQAALDGIWLSAAMDFTVTDATTPKPFTIDIRRPGPPSVITCVDKKGKPVGGVTVAVRNREGPLARRLWPRSFTADAAGVLYLAPLEAGTHVLETSDGKTHELIIEPLPATGGALHRQTIVFD
jgi:hypothetical protein